METQPTTPSPTKGKSVLLIVLIVIFILILGGGAAYYFLVYSKGKTNQNSNLVTNVVNTNIDTNLNKNINNQNVNSASLGNINTNISNQNLNTAQNINISNNQNINNSNINTIINVNKASSINSGVNEKAETLTTDDVYTDDKKTKLGHAELFIPAGAVDTTKISDIYSATWPPITSTKVQTKWSSRNSIGGFYQFHEPSNSTFLKPFTLKIYYTKEALGDSNANNLSIYIENEQTLFFNELVDSKVNSDGNFVSAQFTKLGIFSIFDKTKIDKTEFDSDGDGYSDQTEINNGYNPYGPGKLTQ